MSDTAIESPDANLTVIMVADDYEIIRQLCRTWLELRGYRVIEAENGEEAVEIARRECPNLILMDISMPRLDGFAATRRIREIRELCDVWIVAVSGIGTSHRSAAMAAGFDEFLTKPFDLPQLEKILNHLLSSPPRTATL